MQQLAGRMGWSLLVTSAEESGCAELVDRLKSMGAFGAVLESFDRKILDELHKAGLPAVVVDALSIDVEADVVLQDGEMGAIRAAEHLAGLGHKRIAWIGPELRNGNPQVIDRFCGAVGGLVRHGLSIPEKLRVSIPLDDRDEARRRARALLSRKDRPDAVLALWQKATEALVWAARDLGLTPGRDFGMVGWATKKYYFDRYVPLFQGGPVPPAVVWSLFDMTRAAIRCLTMRRKDPKMPLLQIRVPARLWFYGTPPAV